MALPVHKKLQGRSVLRPGRRRFLSSLSLAGGTAAAASAPTANAAASELETRIRAALDSTPLVNTHEHIIEPERTSGHVDFFTLASHYAISDVVSAGLSSADKAVIDDPGAPMERRWQLFEPHWKNARFTGYGEALRTAIADIYEVEEISSETLSTINDRISRKNRIGLYREVLAEKANIRYSVLDDYWNAAPVKPDPAFFVLARKFDRFVTPQTPEAVHALEALTDVSISDLVGLKQAMEKSFAQSLEAGMVTVKSTLAYSREIRYNEVPSTAAAQDFQRLVRKMRAIPEGFRSREDRPYRALEDHMFHHLIQLAAEHKIPVQIHTGLHAGNGNSIANSNPTHLTNLFFLYPQVKFDLFHVSYPYQGELAVLAKTFPNVHADFCWAHIISGSMARRTLHEMLETVPANKIFGYGGDYRFPELSYAHAKMARRNIGQVLAEKVEARFCGEDEALDLGRMILYDNPHEMFGWRLG